MLSFRFKLPLVTESNKLLTLMLGYFIFCLLYLGAPHFSIREMEIVPSIWIDDFIQFSPLAVWVYLTQYGFLFLAIYYAPNTLSRTIALYSMLLATIIAVIIYILFPTMLPRHPIQGGELTAFLWKFLYFTDVPSNCFPSLHAALALIAVCSLVRRSTFWKCIAPLWALSIIYAALATKQHVVVDILGGLVLGFFSQQLVARIFVRVNGRGG